MTQWLVQAKEKWNVAVLRAALDAVHGSLDGKMIGSSDEKLAS